MTQEAAKQPAGPEVVTSVRLSLEEHARLKEIAALERRSLSNQIRHWIMTADRKAA